ncbi:hypothetical protein R0J91_11705, partial [Micrococcus sp. SIMBA_131]
SPAFIFCSLFQEKRGGRTSPAGLLNVKLYRPIRGRKAKIHIGTHSNRKQQNASNPLGIFCDQLQLGFFHFYYS